MDLNSKSMHFFFIYVLMLPIYYKGKCHLEEILNWRHFKFGVSQKSPYKARPHEALNIKLLVPLRF